MDILLVTLQKRPYFDCMDDMFLVVGRELAQRVVGRRFCTESPEPNCLRDGNAAYQLRYWIRIYNDFVVVDEKTNGRMIWFYKYSPNKRRYEQFKTNDFCKEYLLFHKASLQDLYRMQSDNSKMLGDNFYRNADAPEKDIKCSQTRHNISQSVNAKSKSGL